MMVIVVWKLLVGCVVWGKEVVLMVAVLEVSLVVGMQSFQALGFGCCVP